MESELGDRVSVVRIRIYLSFFPHRPCSCRAGTGARVRTYYVPYRRKKQLSSSAARGRGRARSSLSSWRSSAVARRRAAPQRGREESTAAAAAAAKAFVYITLRDRVYPGVTATGGCGGSGVENDVSAAQHSSSGPPPRERARAEGASERHGRVSWWWGATRGNEETRRPT